MRDKLNHRLANFLWQKTVDRQKVVTVEAGSGPALCSSLIKKNTNVDTAIAVDFDQEVLNIIANRDPNVTLVRSDIRAIPFPDNSIDLVYSSSTIEHIPHPESVLKEMVRITKPGGYIFVGIPYRFGPLCFSLLFPPRSPVPEWVGPLYKESEIHKWHQNLPIEKIEEIYYFFRFFKGYLFKKKID